ncbi:MAG: TRAP transporter small permease [Hyphomicrobiaceae bacterium]|nr:TRAP transporter small permease [Hyphomicrobiaceae bacterium]
MRAILDRVYAASLWLAALALALIATLVLIQVLGRVLDKILRFFGADVIGFQIPSLAEIGGFLFVGASFLALAGTLRAGDHIRVTMLLKAVSPRLRRLMEIGVLALGTGLAGFAAWHSALQVADSVVHHTVSFGMVVIPLWIPQGVMTLGLAVFVLALVDDLVVAVTGGIPSTIAVEESRGIEGGE